MLEAHVRRLHQLRVGRSQGDPLHAAVPGPTTDTSILMPAVLGGGRLWFVRGCENLAGNLSKSGKEQQYQTSSNHVRAINGRGRRPLMSYHLSHR